MGPIELSHRKWQVQESETPRKAVGPALSDQKRAL